MPLFLSLFLLLIPSFLGKGIPARLIVWNVGQGLWVTWVDETYCLHFDSGGETLPLVGQTCSGKRQILALSHSDWDHLNFMRTLNRLGKESCLISRPQEPISSKTKAAWIGEMPICSNPPPQLKEIPTLVPSFSSSRKTKSRNIYSRVYVWRNRILFPGDSPANQEKIWSRLLPEGIQYLIAGHHGSKTSTSRKLLDRIPSLQMAFVSARKEVYGHPHAEVMERALERKIPILKTEEWGNLVVQFRSN